MGNRPNREFEGLEIAEHVGRGGAYARDRAGIDPQRFRPLDVPDPLNDGAMLMPIADQIVVARECHCFRVMRVMHQEYRPLRQEQGAILAVIMNAVGGLLREPGKVKQIARVVAVYQVDRQPQSDDRVQGGGRNQVAAVEDRLSAERFRLGDGRRERLAMVVAVGNDADFQAPPPGSLYLMHC